MTVYVDDIEAPYGRMKMCHMVADTEDELYEMADRIGIARRWYQGDHYDISLSKKALAVLNGAKAITWVELGKMLLQWRREGKWRSHELGKAQP